MNETDTGWSAVPDAHRNWMLKLAVVLDLQVGADRYWVIHAGVPSDVPLVGAGVDEVVPRLARDRPEELLWPATDPRRCCPWTGR